jgi:cellulose biosynthesis protein BcsQ
MTAYAFWNNKGGVGKSFLCFVAATEYAHRHPETDVYVIDLCPQANVSETLLVNSAVLHELMTRTPRATVAGYLEARLNSPFRMITEVAPYVCRPRDFNHNLPPNLLLVCGDNLLEVISEAIRQTSQLSIPVDAWKQVLNWVRDLTVALRNQSGNRDTLFILDCNPSFALYTQLALVAAENLVVPFTADDSSRRAFENVVALLYGYGINDPKMQTYAKISFAKRAKEEGVNIPKLHTFVSNRMTLYDGKASMTFEAMSQSIKQTMDNIHKKHRQIYANPKERPSESFIEIPDYHSACVIITTTGMPLHKLKPGPKDLHGERVQLNLEPLNRYRESLAKFVDYL